MIPAWLNIFSIVSLSAGGIGAGWLIFAAPFAIFSFEIPKTSPVFWSMMQIAMLAGFGTSFPVAPRPVVTVTRLPEITRLTFGAIQARHLFVT